MLVGVVVRLGRGAQSWWHSHIGLLVVEESAFLMLTGLPRCAAGNLVICYCCRRTTGRVTDMEGTFTHARSFNQALASWRVQRVTTMQRMFDSAKSFNQNIAAWSVAACYPCVCLLSCSWFLSLVSLSGFSFRLFFFCCACADWLCHGELRNLLPSEHGAFRRTV